MANTAKTLNLLGWIAGIIASLAVGFSLTSRALVIPFLNSMIHTILGWIVIIGAVIAIFGKIAK